MPSSWLQTATAFVATVWHTNIPHGVYQQLIKQMRVCVCGWVSVDSATLCEGAVPCPPPHWALAFASAFWYVHKFIILKVIGFGPCSRFSLGAGQSQLQYWRQNNKKILYMYIYSDVPTRTVNLDGKWWSGGGAGSHIPRRNCNICSCQAALPAIGHWRFFFAVVIVFIMDKVYKFARMTHSQMRNMSRMDENECEKASRKPAGGCGDLSMREQSEQQQRHQD